MYARQVGPNQFINVWSREEATHAFCDGRFVPVEETRDVSMPPEVIAEILDNMPDFTLSEFERFP